MGGASAQEERWRDTQSSCSLRSAALQDGGSAQAQEEVGHKKERRPRWRTWEEWKRDSFVKKRRRCSGEKLKAQMWESRSAAV